MREDTLMAFPSYRRVKKVKTFAYFDEGTVTCFVEPQEVYDYVSEYPDEKFVIYPEDGWNISKKRGYIVSFAIKHGYKYLLMLEDDFTGFWIREGLTQGGHPKLVKSDCETVFGMMFECMKANNFVELGLSQKQSNHYYEEPEYKISCKITEFCLFDLSELARLEVNYDPDLVHFEDFDITVQILMRGGKAALYIPAAFEHVTMGTNEGGHQVEGIEARRVVAEQAVNAMIRKFPGYVEMGEGRLFPEPKVNWKALRQRLEMNKDAKSIRDFWL